MPQDINHVSKRTRKKVPSPVRKLYSMINRKKTGAESAYAGEKVTPIAGELTTLSMQRVIDIMRTRMNFDTNSRVINIGCGQRKPSLHFAATVNPTLNVGIEIVPWRWYQATTNLKKIYDASLAGKVAHPNCFFQLGNIRKVRSLDPFTHIYMFSTG